mgnify:CR=1 FL=1
MAEDKHIVFSYGRMNPPTAGHSKVVDKVKSHADKIGANHAVIVSHSQNNKTDPLHHEHKKEYLSFGKEKKRSKRRNLFEQMRFNDMEAEILYQSPNLLSGRHKPCIDVRLKANRINDDLKIDNGFLPKFNGCQNRK